MQVVDWFWEWAGRHKKRFPRGDWPPFEDVFWAELLRLFVARGVAEEVAEEASQILFESPPKFPDAHPGALLARAREIWKARPPEFAAANDRDAAHHASRECDDCRGEGVTLRYRRRSRGTPGRDGRPVQPTVTCYCTCPMGRWVEKAHRERSPDVRKRHHDLADFPWLRGHEYRRPGDGPAPDPPAATQPDDWF